MCFGNIDLVTYADLQEKIHRATLSLSLVCVIQVACNLLCSPIPHLKQARTKHIRHEQSHPDDLTRFMIPI